MAGDPYVCQAPILLQYTTAAGKPHSQAARHLYPALTVNVFFSLDFIYLVSLDRISGGYQEDIIEQFEKSKMAAKMVMVHKNRCVGTVSGEMFPEEPKVVPAKLAEEASTDGMTNEQCLFNVQNYEMTTVTKLPTDYVEMLKPALPRVSVTVAEEASADGATNEQCLYDNRNCMKTTSMELPMDYVEILKPALPRVAVTVAEEASTDGATNKQSVYEVLDNKKTTTTKVSMDFLEIPQLSFTRGFLELAEEARNVCVENVFLWTKFYHK